MTITNPEKYMQGVWDWAILDGCFGETRIKPTDIDGLIERNGKFLVLETKSVGADVPHGQMITFRRMVQQGWYVCIVWGEQNSPRRIVFLTPHKSRPEVVFDPASIADLRRIVSWWFGRANRN